jgi:hypothetical protein
MATLRKLNAWGGPGRVVYWWVVGLLHLLHSRRSPVGGVDVKTGQVGVHRDSPRKSSVLRQTNMLCTSWLSGLLFEAVVFTVSPYGTSN